MCWFKLATCLDCYLTMCSAGKSHVCVEELYFGSCTDGFLYLVQLGFTSYCIIIMSCNTIHIILIFFKHYWDSAEFSVSWLSLQFPLPSPSTFSILPSALLISARHVAAYYWEMVVLKVVWWCVICLHNSRWLYQIKCFTRLYLCHLSDYLC